MVFFETKQKNCSIFRISNFPLSDQLSYFKINLKLKEKHRKEERNPPFVSSPLYNEVKTLLE